MTRLKPYFEKKQFKDQIDEADTVIRVYVKQDQGGLLEKKKNIFEKWSK